jgi:hypothetical protein
MKEQPMKETELKPCPFCGGEAKLERAFFSSPAILGTPKKYYLKQNFCIKCKKCGIGIPEFEILLEIDINTLSLKDDFKTQVKSFREKWNRRANNENK